MCLLDGPVGTSFTGSTDTTDLSEKQDEKVHKSQQKKSVPEEGISLIIFDV